MPLSKEILVKYKNRIFVETGTNNGLGVQAALDAGFDKIYSIEFYDKLFEICVEKFKDNSKVHLIYGDSGEKIKDVLHEINEPATFWLDSHFSTSELYKVPLVDSCPILKELDAIRKHKIKSHVILIDDMNYFRRGIKLWNGIREEKIREMLNQINSDYQYSLEDGRLKNDILVATVK